MTSQFRKSKHLKLGLLFLLKRSYVNEYLFNCIHVWSVGHLSLALKGKERKVLLYVFNEVSMTFYFNFVFTDFTLKERLSIEQ